MRSFGEKIIWIIVALIGAIAVTSIVSFAIYGRYGYTYGFGPYGMMGGFPFYGMYIIMPIMAVISILVVILFFRYIFGAMGDHMGYSWNERSRAEDILKERYARGEISQEEFNRMMENLRSH